MKALSRWARPTVIGLLTLTAVWVGADGPPAGVSATEWTGIQEQIEAELHAITESDRPGRLYRADNAAQRFTAHFGAEDVLIAPRGRGEPAWQLGLQLTAWGAADDLQQVNFATATAEDNRIEFRRGPLTEWYVNTAMGLEQGFTIAHPPTDGITELVLEMTIEGNLSAQLAESGQAVTYHREDSNTTLTYSGLKAWDAVNAPLEARMELTRDDIRLRLVVDVRSAAWPITVDPTIAQVAQLFPTPDFSTEGASFGRAVSIDGDLMVVGMTSRETGWPTGAAHIFSRDQGGSGAWQHVTEITSSDGEEGDSFGNAVDISGDTVVVGARGDDDNGSASGSSYIFRPDPGNPDVWRQVAKILPSDGAEGDSFGGSVAISGETVVIGARGDDDHGSFSGSSYVFRAGQGGPEAWGQVAKVLPSDGAEEDYFGGSVAISGEIVVIGALGDDDHGENSGSSYVFQRDQGGPEAWGQIAKLTAADGSPGDAFGSSVSIDTDTAIVGAYGADGTVVDSGAAYIFERHHGGLDAWGQVAKVFASDGADLDHFGDSVDISADTAIVGAWADDDGPPRTGSASIFQRDHGGPDAWGEVEKITAGDGGSYNDFGLSVSISGDTAVAGAPGADDDYSGSGAAYVFERDQGGSNAWGQLARLPCPPVFVARSEAFGLSVSIDGDTAIVGAPADDDNGQRSGSAFVFERDRGGLGVWGLVTRITPADGSRDDGFGAAVAIDDDTVLVGAPEDDPVWPGFGKAYVFGRDHGGTDNWGQVVKITSADGSSGDLFGLPVAISGDTAVVGAPGDDDLGENSGSAYVFRRNLGGSDNWGQVVKITPADGVSADLFGWSAAIDGEIAVIGSPYAYDNGVWTGTAFVFQRDQGGPDAWGQVAKLTASDGVEADLFGASVSIDHDTIVVGAPGDFPSTPGSAYLFRQDHGGPSAWGELRRISPIDGVDRDFFGRSVSISGDIVLVGAPRYSAGSAYVFQRDLGGLNAWGQLAKTSASDSAVNDEFGRSVAADGAICIVGARLNDTLGDNSGSAYVFSISDAFFADGFETGDSSGWSVTVP